MEAWASDPQTAGSHPGWRARLAERASPDIDEDRVLGPILRTLIDGHGISADQGLALWRHPDLSAVTALAHAVKHARYDDRVFFNRNLHVNQTNICTLACRFCAFRRGPRADDAYALDIEAYLARIEPHRGRIDEVHTVGGLHPDWDVDHYAALFEAVKRNHPELHIKALTAVEVKHIAEISELDIHTLLGRLRDSGLDSLPGGGAEILDDDVRDIICRGKESSQEYLDIHRAAHEVGLPTNCTMLFGTVERPEQRIQHLLRLRKLQSETGGFQCFVPYPFLPDRTRLPEAQLASGHEILRMIAVSRLVLDNVPHIKAYRMNIGDRLAELALCCGADDIDGTVGHEEIMHEAGSTTPVDHGMQDLARSIEDAGGLPVQRNTTYTRFRRWRDEDEDDRGLPLPVANLG